MATSDDETQRLRAVGLQNAQTILLAHRRAEEALHKQSEWLRVTLSSIGDAVISTDAECRVTFLNGVAESLTGWPQAEALGRPLPDVFHVVNEQSRQPVENPAMRALAEGRIVGLSNHAVLIAKDGTERPIDDSAAPIRDEGSAILGAVLVFRDVTERRQAEKERRESEERFRSLVSATAQVVWTTDRDGKVVEDSPSWRAFTGQNYEQWKGWGWLDAIHPDDREGTAHVWRQGVKDKCLVQTAYRLRAADGSYRWTAVRAVPVLETDGRVREWVGMNTDITQRKQAEEALRQSEERFRMLADNIPQLAWIADAGTEGKAIWFNKVWLDYTGTTIEQMQGSGWKSVHHPDHVEAVAKKFEHHVKECVDWEDTFPLRGKDGQYRWFLSRMRVIRNESGTVVRLFGTNTDITEQRQMADELRQNAADMLQADQRKNEFLALLAHELRNPLAPIRNAVQFLRLAKGNPEATQSASAIMERQIGQMVHLVDDLLDVGRISSGKIILQRERTELASVLHHAAEAARPRSESMEQELKVTLPAEPIFLDADSTRLTQIVGNLLNNASKFTPRLGRIRLTAEKGDTHAVIRVQDTGIGIAADQLPRIFDMFMQVDTSLEREQGGLGLGLSLVKRLVELHDGTIEASSGGLGKGSAFVVRLPLSNASPPAALKASSIDQVTISRRILVVDDNVDSANSLAMVLRLSGHDAHTAYDGIAAVEAAAKLQPDVILLDIGLPKLNGYEAARRIRQQQGSKRLMLVALTGWGQDEDKRRSLEAGFDVHLVKPIDSSDLEKLLHSMPPLV